MNGQAISGSYDLAPRPPTVTLPLGKIDRRYTARLRMIDNLLTGEGGGEVGGRGAESYYRRKAWSPIKHPMISLL